MINGDSLKAARIHKGLSTRDLADKMGVSERVILDWEDEEKDPTPDEIINLSTILDVAINDLYDDDLEDRLEEKNNKGLYGLYKRFPYPIFTVLVYLILGFYLKLWHPGWLVFLTIPLYYTADCFFIKGKSLKGFAYPVFATLIFLFVGTVYGYWHPTWIIFLTVPLYYGVVK